MNYFIRTLCLINLCSKSELETLGKLIELFFNQPRHKNLGNVRFLTRTLFQTNETSVAVSPLGGGCLKKNSPAFKFFSHHNNTIFSKIPQKHTHQSF